MNDNDNPYDGEDRHGLGWNQWLGLKVSRGKESPTSMLGCPTTQADAHLPNIILMLSTFQHFVLAHCRTPT